MRLSKEIKDGMEVMPAENAPAEVAEPLKEALEAIKVLKESTPR